MFGKWWRVGVAIERYKASCPQRWVITPHMSGVLVHVVGGFDDRDVSLFIDPGAGPQDMRPVAPLVTTHGALIIIFVSGPSGRPKSALANAKKSASCDGVSGSYAMIMPAEIIKIEAMLGSIPKVMQTGLVLERANG